MVQQRTLDPGYNQALATETQSAVAAVTENGLNGWMPVNTERRHIAKNAKGYLIRFVNVRGQTRKKLTEKGKQINI